MRAAILHCARMSEAQFAEPKSDFHARDPGPARRCIQMHSHAFLEDQGEDKGEQKNKDGIRARMAAPIR